MAGQRVLLVHLTSNGDCLMATTVARQIKNDYPGCHLTWAISRQCKQVIENNPFVDEIWSVEYEPYDHPHDDVWRRTKAEALRRQQSGRSRQPHHHEPGQRRQPRAESERQHRRQQVRVLMRIHVSRPDARLDDLDDLCS